MKIKPFFILLLLLCIQPFSCSKDKPDHPEILARVNDYNLTLHEFQTRLAAELEMEKDFKLTKEARDEFLDEIIKKELLIQEAKKLDLDKEDRFIRAIERYWESTLITNLMEKKGDEISRRIVISQEEIRERYNSMKRPGEDLPPLEKLEEGISAELREIKKTKKLSEWIDALMKNAKIVINRELLYKD